MMKSVGKREQKFLTSNSGGKMNFCFGCVIEHKVFKYELDEQRVHRTIIITMQILAEERAKLRFCLNK